MSEERSERELNTQLKSCERKHINMISSENTDTSQTTKTNINETSSVSKKSKIKKKGQEKFYWLHGFSL